jgi:O-antigen ligase
MNTGVTQDKNALGGIAAIITLGVLWNVLDLLRDKGRPNRGRHLLAQGVLLALGVTLLVMANSATAETCGILGAALMLTTRLSIIRRRPATVHALVLSLLLFGGLDFFLGGEANVTQALGRKSDLSGRTEIWAAVLPAVPNKIVGAGFESFWISPCVEKVRSSLSLLHWYNPQNINEAHNGYIEVYLNLGWVGVGLITLILFKGYRDIVAVFRRDPVVGSRLLAYFFLVVFYGITEACFRLLSTTWIFLLLAVVAAGGAARGAGAQQPVVVPPKRSPWLPAKLARQIAPSSGPTTTDDLTALRRS